MHTHRQERGFALVGAVFALVIIASLVAGAFFASRQELSVGRSTQTYERAFEAAEAGINRQVAAWNTSVNALAVGDSMTMPTYTLPGSNATASSLIKRLNTQLFLIRTTGTSGTSSRTLASLARLQVLTMDFQASLTTRSTLKLGGSSQIDGTNTNPTGWSCAAATDTLAGIRTPDSTQISTSGCGSYSCVSGSPKIQQDSTVSTSTFFNYGSLTWTDLISMASITYTSSPTLSSLAPIATGGVCDNSNTNNWGEPWRGGGTVSACYNYMPIIYFAADAHITGGRGQGIMLVEGDLDVQGGFEFYGPVIVKGSFSTQGTGGHFTGGVMASNVDLELNSVLGDAVITYSDCAIESALQASALGRVLRERSWAEITQ